MDQLPFKPSEIRVLVGDEHDLMRKSIERVLERIGVVQYVDAHHGRDVRRMIQAEAFDLYILDLYYSDTDGFDILQMIRNKDIQSDTPIIAITGEANRDDIVKAIDLGANDYLLKPFQPEELEKKIITVLTQYHSPGPVVKLIRKAEQLIHSGDYAPALSIIEKILQRKADHPTAEYLKALILYKDSQVDLAIAKLQANIKKYPEYLKNYKTLSDLYIEQGRQEEAVDALTKELEANPKQLLRQIKVANIHLKLGQNMKAIEHLRLALLENNKNPEALYGMGVAYAKENNLEKSIYYFKRLRRQYPDNSKPLEAIVKFCQAIHKEKLAEMVLRDEKKGHPQRVDTYRILAKLYLSEGKEEEGLATLEEAVQKNPSNLSAYQMLAKHFVDQGELDSASGVFDRYIAITKDHEGYLYQTEIYLQAKNYAQAISAIHNGMAASSDHGKLLKLLCICTLKTQQLAKGYFIQKRMFKLGHKDPTIVAKHRELKNLVINRRESRRPKKSAS
ncbi:tetratricopeptide repeat protein [Pseudobacteriovorax antillogorgiicola]|uniref:Tetratricopeptide repeat-containing protein n=1 Tax=Pseudobacteriovorax antillogorgiicola TaxID=1513793 RepID=A0A1Y6B8G0_9BACT|nr:tetratricopeptide repeat protein [Pseudobacteriovorax antillogorgiicola]TCS59271.1 tetratricopeptide repeat protein [Pseudobacteriovorax antillogorgiicola]SME89882.1 Tetratricopeptide repeat-containing protein [Pseudobacteriovorax antillogorgiicola]